MSINVEHKVYKDGDDELRGLLANPKNVNTKLPTVLVFPALFGLSEHEEETAKMLAKFGFVAFAADVYGGGKNFDSREEAFAEIKKYREARSTRLRNRLLAAVNFVKSLPIVDEEKINAIGFCFGGLCSLDLIRINVVASAVSFHGSFQPIDGETNFHELDPIRKKILICHGDNDAHVNPTVDAFIEELRARKADFQFIRYSDALHGFTMKSHKFEGIPGVGYHELTAKRSKRAMLLFFNELYGLPKLDQI
ncbi:DLH domain-containing protein [Aphelenchoides besseyi]|nr:DLH domain-containing protein [Aphelenchoides besseyi]